MSVQIRLEQLRPGLVVDVKICHVHYDAVVVDVDRLGCQVKLGWMPDDEAFGDESWWNVFDIEIRRKP